MKAKKEQSARRCPNCKHVMEDRTENWSHEDDEQVWYCSECDEAHTYITKHCPRCEYAWEEEV